MGTKSGRRLNKVASFVSTLRLMLNRQSSEYISWSEQQNSFKIKNPSRFTQEILSRYFKHQNFSSFIRQLNIYNFKKISNEKYPDQYFYTHPCFQKNKPELLKYIKRKVQHSQNKSINNPNHYNKTHQKQSTINFSHKKSLTHQIEDNLQHLKHQSTQLKQQNHQLKEQMIECETQNSLILKNLNCLLLKSYSSQYIHFASKIQSQLQEQSKLIQSLQNYNLMNALLMNWNRNAMNLKNSSTNFTNQNSFSSGVDSNRNLQNLYKNGRSHHNHMKHKNLVNQNQKILKMFTESEKPNSEHLINQNKYNWISESDSQKPQPKVYFSDYNNQKSDNFREIPHPNSLKSNNICVINLKNNLDQQRICK